MPSVEASSSNSLLIAGLIAGTLLLLAICLTIIVCCAAKSSKISARIRQIPRHQSEEGKVEHHKIEEQIITRDLPRV